MDVRQPREQKGCLESTVRYGSISVKVQ